MSTIVKVHPKSLNPNPIAIQIYTDTPENYDVMKENIGKVGILEPLIVNEHTGTVISGNIRLKIANELSLSEVPVILVSESNLSADILTVSHGQQRIKKPSEILKEREIWERAFPVSQGARTDLNPTLKRNKEMLDSIDFGISQSKLQNLKTIDKLAKELYGVESPFYKDLWAKIDSGYSGLRSIIKTLSDEFKARENRSILPNHVEIIDNRVKVFNKSCQSMKEIQDNCIACIMTSPPYFQMRDYGTGKDQRGLENDVNTFLNGLINDFRDCKRVLKEDGSLWVNLGEAVIEGQYNAIPHRFVVAMMNDGWIFNDEIVWIKNNPIFTTANRTVRSHEYIFHFVKSTEFHYDSSWTKDLTDDENLVSRGTGGKMSKLASAMDFRGSIVRTNGNNMDHLRGDCKEYGFYLTHNAAFPLSIPAMAILCTSKVGDTILDIYSGTGTTGEAALELERNYIGYEIKPEFVLSSAVRMERFLETTTVPELMKAA